jgi:hypothetical protein
MGTTDDLDFRGFAESHMPLGFSDELERSEDEGIDFSSKFRLPYTTCG